jgi:heme/copper-type cytochrome/quinol oxidase subunit 2
VNKSTRIGVIVLLIAIAAGGFLFLSGNFNPSKTPAPTGQVQEFEITAKRFEFNPSRIEMKRGDTVILKVTGLDDGEDHGHGFTLLNYGIRRVIRGGQTISIKFIASETGTFTFFCSVPCGAGHSSMTGTLTIT